MFIICKAVGNKNYANGLAETVMQTHVLSEKLVESLMWNRFVNTRGKVASNIAIDLHMEHENRVFLDQLTSYRGKFSQGQIDRISKSQTAVNAILNRYDVDIQAWEPGSKPTKPVSKEDVLKLVEIYRPANLFTKKPGRNHSPELVFMRQNVMEGLTDKELRKWLTDKFRALKGISTYKQFERWQEEDEEVVWTDMDDLDSSFLDLSMSEMEMSPIH